jgi:hypothetical protein
MLMIISVKQVEFGNFLSNYIYWVQMCFWPFKLQFLIMCFYEKLFIFYVVECMDIMTIK